MKLLLVLAAVGAAVAEPEADPAFAYSVGAPLLHPVTYAAHVPLSLTYTHVLPAAGCRNVAGALVPCAHGTLPYLTVAPAAAEAAEEPAVEEARKKREADPAVLATSTVVKNPLPTPLLAPLSYYTPYAAYPGLYSGLFYGRKKREAEAEADPEADPWLLYGYPYAYSHAFYHPYALHAAGCRNYLGALVPCAGR